jgi:hypothetical protein
MVAGARCPGQGFRSPGMNVSGAASNFLRASPTLSASYATASSYLPSAPAAKIEVRPGRRRRPALRAALDGVQKVLHKIDKPDRRGVSIASAWAHRNMVRTDICQGHIRNYVPGHRRGRTRSVTSTDSNGLSGRVAPSTRTFVHDRRGLPDLGDDFLLAWLIRQAQSKLGIQLLLVERVGQDWLP